MQTLREKSRTFYGAYKIPLDKFRYEEVPANPRQLNSKNSESLLEIFEIDVCDRVEPKHYVSAIIPKVELPQQYRSDYRLYDEPQFFDPPQPLVCIHGQHRLKAADDFLAGEERWWVANLYSDDINTTTKNSLREEFDGSINYSDGDVYRHFLITSKDITEKNKWLARLSKEKRRVLLRMEKSDTMRVVRDGLMALTPFIGLWPVLELAQFQRLLKTHCPQEMAHYLEQIKNSLTLILGDSVYNQNRLDAHTVYVIQGRCPFRSSYDRAYIQRCFENGDILPGLASDARHSALQQILSIEHNIPSLYTFLKDTMCLEHGAKILKSILPNKSRGSLVHTFSALHNKQTMFKEQIGESIYRYKEQSTAAEVDWLAYRQLWALIIRHFPAPRKDTPKRANATGISRKRKRDESPQGLKSSDIAISSFRKHWLHDLASLASANGYQRMQQVSGGNRSADIIMARDFLRDVRPPEYYQLDHDQMLDKADLICKLLEQIEPLAPRAKTPEWTSDYENCGSDIDDRCGRPQQCSIDTDKQSFFLQNIYPESLVIVPKRYLTSFACKRDMFCFFFGSLQNPDTSLQKSETVISHISNVVNNGHQAESAPTNQAINNTILGKRAIVHSLESISTDAAHSVDSHRTSSACLPIEIKEWQDPVREQDEQPQIVSFTEASRLLCSDSINQIFTVLSPTQNDSFRIRCVNLDDKEAIVMAMGLPCDSHFILKENGKGLKLVDPRTIVEEAQSNQIKAVVKISGNNSHNLISRLQTI